MKHYACAILLRHGHILLGKRAPHRKAYPNCWDVIGGRVEQDESIVDALHRELGEEIGIVPIIYEHLRNLMDNGPQGEATYHLHVVRSWTGSGPTMMNDEHTALTWFPIEKACSLPDLALASYATMFRSIR